MNGAVNGHPDTVSALTFFNAMAVETAKDLGQTDKGLFKESSTQMHL